MMRALLLALQFLTRLPMPGTRDITPRDMGRSLLFYPAVGLLIGTLLALLSFVLDQAAAGVSAALLLTLWVLITGALHLDGLADSADAWVGGHGDRERTLAIMKDPAAGPAGVTVLVLVLLLKYAALQALCADGVWLPLLVAPLLGRAVLPLLFLTTPYVRPGGLGEALAQQLNRPGAVAVLVAAGALVPLLAGRAGFGMLAAALVVFLALRALMLKRLGGTTGDTAGALVEITEAASLASAFL